MVKRDDMDASKDAHGHMIWNAYKGLPSFSVIERADGYVNLDETSKLYLADYSHWRRHEKEAIKYAKGRVIDIGCGGGRVLLYMQKKGQKVTGIDISPLAIKVCRLRGAKDARVMALEDIGRFRPNSFDTIVMFGYNFGLFGGREKAKRLLKAMHRVTSERAVIIAETRDPYLTDNPVHFRYHRLNARKGRMPGQMRFRARFMQYATDWYDYLYVSKSEMKGLLAGTGWRVKRFIDADNHKKSGLYIAIIEKA